MVADGALTTRAQRFIEGLRAASAVSHFDAAVTELPAIEVWFLVPHLISSRHLILALALLLRELSSKRGSSYTTSCG